MKKSRKILKRSQVVLIGGMLDGTHVTINSFNDRGRMKFIGMGNYILVTETKAVWRDYRKELN